jgi:Spy/CpxP family protein refolding chaperone
MKTKHLLKTGLAFAFLMLISSQVSAGMWGQNYGSMMGRGMMNGPMMGSTGYNNYGPALTETKQAEVKEIEDKYQGQLTEKETALRNKAAQLQTAESNDSATLGERKKLRNELYDLEQDYWVTRNKANQEIGSVIGTPYYGNTGWGPSYCTWHDNHPGMYGNSTPHMYSQRTPMMNYGRGGCRW